MEEMPPSPAARKLMVESDLGAGEVIGSGRRGQVLKDDVARPPKRFVRASARRRPRPGPARRSPRAMPRAKSACA